MGAQALIFCRDAIQLRLIKIKSETGWNPVSTKK